MRSSSFNAYSMCPMRYFIDFNLLRPGLSGLAADKGTAFHKIMEIIAICKKNASTGEKVYVDEIVGKIKTTGYNIEDIIKGVYSYYIKTFPHHKWANKDYEEIKEWINLVMTTYDNGEWNPQNLDIVDTETKFDFEILKPWAQFKFDVCGKEQEGFLRMKGSIDLVIKISDNVYMSCDWKSGRNAWDWAKNKEKTIEDFYNDPQLRIYHYALCHLYPDIENIWAAIMYVKGKSYKICFDRNDLPKTEEMIRKRFEEIRDCTNPAQYKSFKCRSFCWHGKNTFEGTDIKPIQEFRTGQTCKRGEKQTICEQVKYELDKKGLKKVVEEYKIKDKEFDYYQSPGGANDVPNK